MSDIHVLQVGINYFYTDDELRGCIEDISCVQKYLEIYHGVPLENFQQLRDDSLDINKIPTKNNILKEIEKLIEKSKTSYLVIFNYSGHGSYLKNTSGDFETTKRDQCICPLDYNDNGYIIDDDIFELLVSKVECNLLIISDSCFSGSVCDLEFNYDLRKKNYQKVGTPNESKFLKISISGCSDRQTSSDSLINKKYRGAMTWSFLEALRKNNFKSISYIELLSKMRSLLKENNFDQKPQLSSNKKIPIESNFILFRETLILDDGIKMKRKIKNKRIKNRRIKDN